MPSLAEGGVQRGGYSAFAISNLFFIFPKKAGVYVAKSKKTLIKEDLQAKMEQRNLTSPLYTSLLDQYLKAYDQLRDLEKLRREAENSSQYIGYSNEARQLQKSMLSILNYLGIDPAKESDDGGDYDL